MLYYILSVYVFAFHVKTAGVIFKERRTYYANI